MGLRALEWHQIAPIIAAFNAGGLQNYCPELAKMSLYPPKN